MSLDADTLHQLLTGTPADAWRLLIDKAVEIVARPISPDHASSETTKRDREIGELDFFLSTTSWDLWHSFGDVVERTSDRLIRWWETPFDARAILILDGLSLRELPWLLQGAKEHGFTVHGLAALASELPGDTNEFAQALGFNSRGQLQNNGGGAANKLAPCRTECVDMPWQDCTNLIDASPNWVFWHHWPDSKLHDLSGAGQGHDILTRDVAAQLTSTDFWQFVARLATGRRVVITSDHGYAAVGLYSDASTEQAAFMKATFKNGRGIAGTEDPGPFVPPVALQIHGPHGAHLLAVGRWKWKGPGGYPTLTHGGLSLLEVLSPYVELSRWET